MIEVIKEKTSVWVLQPKLKLELKGRDNSSSVGEANALAKALPNIKAGPFDVSSKYSAIACEVEIVVPLSSMKTGTVPAGLIERNSCRRSQMGSTASDAVIFFSPNTILIFLEKGSRGKCNRLGITLRVHKREFLNKG